MSLSLILTVFSALVVLALLCRADPWAFILMYWIVNMIKNGKECRQ